MSAKRKKGKGLGPGRGSPRWPEEKRLQALELADEIGPMAASRKLGIPSGTIKGWRAKAGQIGPPQNEKDPDDWAHRKRKGADETWDEARAALSLVRERLVAGDERKAKDAALTMAILLDKSAALEQASALYEERQARLQEAQVEAIAHALTGVISDLGIPRSEAVRDVLAHHLIALEQPWDETPRGPAVRASDARAELRARLRTEIEAEVRSEILDQQSRLLPEQASGDAGSGEEEPEVVQGEVVDLAAKHERQDPNPATVRQAERPPRIGPDI